MNVVRPSSSLRASLVRVGVRGLLVASLLVPVALAGTVSAVADTDPLEVDAPRHGDSPPQGDSRDPGGEVEDPYGPYGPSGSVGTAAEDDDLPDGDGDADDPDGDDGGVPDDVDDGAGDDVEADQPAEALPLRDSVVEVAGFQPSVRIHGGGWGHGVGMSQYGAYAMALEGYSAEDILTFYYEGTQVTDDGDSDRRIRVGLRTGQSESQLEAIDGAVEWFACGEPGSEPTERIDQSDCEPWFEQAADTAVQAITADDGGVEVEPVAGGGDGAEPWQATDRPVARAVHGDGAVEGQSQDGQRREYRFGWRDFHHLSDGLSVVQDVDTVEHYLRGLAEVPNSWGEDGPAAMRAQAITGRTFALRALNAPRGGGCACDLLATPADQVFIGEDKVNSPGGQHWASAVEDSDRRVLRDGSSLAETFYSSSHGLGRSEAIEDSWAYGTTPISYLASIDDPWSAHPDAGNPRARWFATADNATMAAFLSAGRDTTLERVTRLEVRSRTDGRTPVDVAVSGVTDTEERESFTLAGRPGDAKPITGASMRRFLPIEAGGTGGRLYSSQIDRFSFGPFEDDEGHAHEYTISWTHNAGIVAGFPDDTFRPNRSVTRGQLATYLVNTFDIATDDPHHRFDDVPPEHTHAANIEAIAEAGVAGGFADGTFRPGEPVTRAQMATMLAGSLALSSSRTGSFVDVDDDDTHAASIEAIAEGGITQGCSASRFCPTDPVRRGQLASFVHRIVQEATS